MPAMPQGDPWPSIKWLLRVEESIRLEREVPVFDGAVDPYWLDLGRLLKIRPLVAAKNKRGIVEVKNAMHSKVYDTYIREKEGRAAAKSGNKKNSSSNVPSTGGKL